MSSWLIINEDKQHNNNNIIIMHFMPACIHIYVSMYVLCTLYMHAYIPACMRSYIYTFIHAYLHTYIHNAYTGPYYGGDFIRLLLLTKVYQWLILLDLVDAKSNGTLIYFGDK